jgi:flagellar motor component MotA
MNNNFFKNLVAIIIIIIGVIATIIYYTKKENVKQDTKNYYLLLIQNQNHKIKLNQFKQTSNETIPSKYSQETELEKENKQQLNIQNQFLNKHN